MAHTTKIHKTVFIHDGDFEGNVFITHGTGKVELPMEDLKEFIAEYIRDKRQQELESATTEDLLK